jgi:threonylcarbamoyladenosine tRNA methylthiotransferase MtaB
MIRIGNTIIEQGHFPDNSLMLKITPNGENAVITWNYESDIELFTLICIVNTCTVTAKAEQKCRRVINLLLKTFVNSAIIVTGCYAEVEKEFISKMNPRIVVIPGTQKDILTKIPELIKSEIEKNPKLKELSLANFIKSNLVNENLKFLPQDRFKLSTDTFFNHSRSSIKIQDGCANSCTFCRIHIPIFTFFIIVIIIIYITHS